MRTADGSRQSATTKAGDEDPQQTPRGCLVCICNRHSGLKWGSSFGSENAWITSFNSPHSVAVLASRNCKRLQMLDLPSSRGLMSYDRLHDRNFFMHCQLGAMRPFLRRMGHTSSRDSGLSNSILMEAAM